MFNRRKGWSQLVALCLMFAFLFGTSGLMMPGVASGAEELPVTVTEEGIDNEIPAAPVLNADDTDNIIGQPVDITFSDDGTWSGVISSVIVADTELAAEQYEVSSERITLAADVFAEAGDYEVLVKAAGYSDTSVIQTMAALDVPDVSTTMNIMMEGLLTPPDLSADISQNLPEKTIEITFTDDAAWRDAITTLTIDESELTKEQYTIAEGKITLVPALFPTAKDYTIVIQATGYDDATVTQAIQNAWIIITGDGVTTPTEYTRAEVEAMTCTPVRLYSTINTWPTKKFYWAEGVKLADLLTAAGIKPEAKSITFKSSDGFTKSMTRDQLDATRYYYPGLKENHEYFGYILGSPDNAEEVDIILALKSIEGSENLDYIGSREAPHLIMGQRWLTEQTNEIYVKYVKTITVSTETPAKWETPAADTPSGTVPAGTEVALSTSNMDGDSIHYTTDGTNPTVESPMYNWIKKRWWGSRSDELATINHKITVDRTMTLKAKSIGPGQTDSDIATYEYRVTDAYPPTLTRDTTNVCVNQEIEITFPEDQQWADAITAISVDGTPLTSDKYTKTSNKITFIPGVFTEANDYAITISATDFRDASLVQKIVAENINPPALSAETINNAIGQAIGLTFTEDAGWQAAITQVSVDGVALAVGQYTVGTGIITIATGILTEAKDYTIAVQAIGYNDVTVTQTMRKIPPVLNADTTDFITTQPIELTFTEDANWQAAVTKVLVGDVATDQYTVGAGTITIAAGVLGEVKDYTVTVQATGYVDTSVTQTIWPDGLEPPTLASDTTNNAIGQPLELAFTDNADWRAAITKVMAGTTELTTEQYTQEAGKITILAGVLPLGEQDIVISATGYKNAFVVQPVVAIPPVFTPQTVNNGTGALISITYPSNSTYKSAIKAVLVDGSPLATDQYSAILSGKINIYKGVLNEVKDYTIVVQAQGYLDATVIQPIKQASPTLAKDRSSADVGQPIDVTFTDDPTWRDAVTGVSVDSIPLGFGKYTLEAGKLTFKPGVFPEYRSSYSSPYVILVKANGYADSSVTQGINWGPALKLTPDTTDNTIDQPIELTFNDDPYWRSVITDVQVDSVSVPSDKYAFTEGKLTIQPGVFLNEYLFEVRVKAAGYRDSCISQTIGKGYPVLTADATDNIVGNPIQLTFVDDEIWRTKINGVTVNSSAITSDKYVLEAGQLTIDASVFTAAGDYAIVVKALNYSDAAVTQTMLAAPGVLAVAGDGADPVSYSMAELQAMTPTTGTYTSKSGDISCTGVALSDLLIALNVSEAEWEVQINTTDAATYPVAPITVADALDPVNRYLVTYAIDGQPIIGDATTLRMYWSGKVIKNVTGITITKRPVYTVAPVEDPVYTPGTQNGINTMTVNAGIIGLKYFGINIAPVTPHEGNEAVVFTHTRNNAQMTINVTKADFDVVSIAQAGFNVLAGDVVKAYVVDDLTNSNTINPIILQ